MDGAPCGRPPLEGDPEGSCYFHSKTRKDPTEFWNRVQGVIQSAEAEGRVVDCTRFEFPSRFKVPKDTVFPPRINFREATLGDDATFRDAMFGNDASFWGATFGNDADFNNATFGDDAVFVDATFGDDADFNNATFGDDAVFVDATFGDDASFWGATFGDRTTFQGATFGDGAEFVGATFGGDARFVDLRRRSSSSTNFWIDFQAVRMRGEGRVEFAGIRNPDDDWGRLDCSRILFAHTDVARIRFRNCKWDQEPAWRGRIAAWRANRQKKKEPSPGEAGQPRTTGKMVRIADEDLIAQLPGVRHAPKPSNGHALALSIAGDTYRGIRISYENAANYAEAGAFHYREMEMRRLSARRETRRWPEAAALWLYKHLGRYGDSAARPLALLVLLVVGWAFLPAAWAKLWGLGADAEGQELHVAAAGNNTAGNQAAGDAATGGATDAVTGLPELFLDALRDVLGSRIIADSFPAFAVQVIGLFLVVLFGVGLRRRYRRGSAGGRLG